MKLAVAPEVADAIAGKRAVVALESTVIAHGLPRSRSLRTAQLLETEIRALGAIPATIALHDGRAVVGVGDHLLARLAGESRVPKVSLRDLAPVLAGQGIGATTAQTGVEMEALTAVTIAGLTLYDMLKSVERGAHLTDVRLVEKTGGKSGTFRAT